MLGGILGAVTGLFGSKRTAGKDAGNELGLSTAERNQAREALSNLLNLQQSDASTGVEGTRLATKEVLENELLKRFLGSDPTSQLSKLIAEEESLAKTGYQLAPEDRTAYGQVSGDIARQFDQAEAGLAQALANRGLSSSGVAGKKFMTSQGSKNEQLAKLQTEIADRRMANTLNRLNTTRNLIGNYGGQAQSAIGNQWERQFQGEQMRQNLAAQKAQAAANRLANAQGQANIQLQQRQATQTVPTWAQAGMGAATGFERDIDRSVKLASIMA